MERAGALHSLPFPVAASPAGGLWDAAADLPAGEACRASFVASIPTLRTRDLGRLTFAVDPACADAESRNDASEDYPALLSAGFAATLERAAPGLRATDVANRARFAGSCMGCHHESSDANLGAGLVAPSSPDFVHVGEIASADCGRGVRDERCYPLSPAIATKFLPSRVRALALLWRFGAPPKVGATGVTSVARVANSALPLADLLRADAAPRPATGGVTLSSQSVLANALRGRRW